MVRKNVDPVPVAVEPELDPAAVAPPDVEQLQAQLTALRVEHQAALVAQAQEHAEVLAAVQSMADLERNPLALEVKAANEALASARADIARLEVALAVETATRVSAETALGSSRSIRAAFEARSVYQIIPKHQANQGRSTRLYVLADDAADAIKRAVATGRYQASDIANVTSTDQKIVIGDD